MLLGARPEATCASESEYLTLVHVTDVRLQNRELSSKCAQLDANNLARNAVQS